MSYCSSDAAVGGKQGVQMTADLGFDDVAGHRSAQLRVSIQILIFDGNDDRMHKQESAIDKTLHRMSTART
jgi:hypothetical protein